jgi:hypothetical protein
MDKSAPSAKPLPANWNRVGYSVFTLAGIGFTFWGSDPIQGPMYQAGRTEGMKERGLT